MTSVAVRFSEGQDREVWTRLCARFFDVLRARGVINEEQAQRFLRRASEGEPPHVDQGGGQSAEEPAVTSDPLKGERARMEAEERKQQEAALNLLGGGGAEYAFERRLKPR